jgi:putative DNA-binding protein
MPRMALGRVQRWMQAVIVHPGTVDDGIRSPAAVAEEAAVEDVVRPSARLTAAERVGIYHGMYLGRMVEALECDYPALQRLLGGKGFAGLVRDYVQAHPSRSYTLNRLGDFLPEFVAAAPRLPDRGFCHDLARLERAMSQVFDEEDTPALTPEAIAAVPADAWEGARLHPIAAFRLLAVRHPVNAYLDWTNGEGPAVPHRRRRQGGVAVYRRTYGIYRLDLSLPAHALLEALAGGATIGEAVGGVLAQRGKVAAADLFQWFRAWMAGGIFRAVTVEGGGPGRTRTFD